MPRPVGILPFPFVKDLRANREDVDARGVPPARGLGNQNGLGKDEDGYPIALDRRTG